MQTLPIGVIGASGYSGIEASRILASHPRVELRLLGSDKWAGETAARRAGLWGNAGKLKYAPQAKAVELARECAAVLLATPAEASLELVPKLLDAGVKVIDLSGAFRLRDAASFEKHYGLKHPQRGSALRGVLRHSRACADAAGHAPRRQPGLLPDGGRAGARAAASRKGCSGRSG